MNIQLKLLVEQDVNAYKNLRLKSFQEAPFAFSESYEDEVKKLESEFLEELKILNNPPECYTLGAFSENNELIGFVKFRRDLRSKARHKSMIYALYVDEKHRKQGIAKKLLLEVLQKAQKLSGLEQIHLWVLHADNSVSDFYKKCGFESQGTRVKNDLKINGIYVDAEYMVKYLND